MAVLALVLTLLFHTVGEMHAAPDTSLEAKYALLEDPGIREFMIAGERLYPADAVDFTIAQQREFYDHYCAHFRKPRPERLAVSDFGVSHSSSIDVACRRYVPEGARRARLLYLHGGGFVVGGLESHDDVCAELSAGARVETVAVQYRLAPEHPFPAAFDDCRAVLAEMIRDERPVVLAGDSAGGNLAAALSLHARDTAPPVLKQLLGQVLIYPGLGGDVSRGSYVSQGRAPGLSTEDVLYYHRVYGGGHNPYAAPLLAQDFARLPPAFIVAAGIDPLHDDGFDYAARLQAAGISAEVRDEPLLVHAFLRARHMSRPAGESFRAITEAIARFAATGG